MAEVEKPKRKRRQSDSPYPLIGFEGSRSCVTGKVCHETKALAKDALRRCKSHGTPIKNGLSWYKCPSCGWYHLGNRKRRTE